MPFLMFLPRVRTSSVLLLAPLLAACSGTRLYERADAAAAAGQYDRAVAYDAQAANDRPAQPVGFDERYAAHLASYVDGAIARLGAPSLANADAQAAELRALLAWSKGQGLEAVVGSRVKPRLGELARVRWVEVRKLASDGQVDEAVVLGQALLADADGASAEQRELTALVEKTRQTHAAEVQSLAAAPGHDGAVALHDRFARQMGAPPTEIGAAAERALARSTGMKATITSSSAGICDDAVTMVRSLLPNDGDTPVQFSFRFDRCSGRPETSTVQTTRTDQVDYEVDQTVSDLRPRMECHSVSTGSSTICDTHDFNGNLLCHQEQTSGQKCDTRFDTVEHTERVRRTRNVQRRVDINRRSLAIDFQATLSTDLDGKHYEVQTRGTASSGTLSLEDAWPAESAAQLKATQDLAQQLDGATRALAAFARHTQAERLRGEANAARAAGDPARAESLDVEVSIIEGAPVPELKPAGVSRPQLAAALASQPYTRTDVVGSSPALPAVAEAEILEDAHERTDSLTLSAETRAGAQGGFILAGSDYRTPSPGNSSKGLFVGSMVTGAEEMGTRFTGVGGSFHLFGNFDSRTASFDTVFDLGFGLKIGQLYLMPVGGVAFGTSTHANPEDPEFRPDAAVRATAFDGVYGGQVTLALPYPVNITLNAQLVRTAPIPLNDFRQWDTRAFVTLGYHLSKDVDLFLFGRYWEMSTVSVKPLEFFKGNGADHRMFSAGLGIGGTSEKFFSGIFGLKH